MIEIYFDGVLIDSDYYANITNEFKLFDEEFMLGTTTSNTFDIEVPYDAVDSIPLNVVIKLDGVDYATMIVDKYEIKDNNILSLTLTDKMTLLNVPYDASLIVPCTTLDILQNICLGTGIELGTTSFTNSDVLVDYYDNSLTARDYVGYIAELNGGYAVIGQDGKLYLKKFNSVPANIDIEECEDFKIGEHHIIERVVFDNGLLKFETSQDETLETLYLNSENVYINTQEVFDNIANEILGFEFYNFETGNCIINSSLQAGDLINFTDGTNNYQTIAQYSLDYYGSWIGGYSLDINSKQQQETQQTGVETKIKNIQVRLNRDENVLGIVVEESSENNSQISNLIIKTDGLVNTLSKKGGTNLLFNTYFSEMDQYGLLTYWSGVQKVVNKFDSKSRNALSLQNGTIKQSVNLVNTNYTLSFKFIKLIEVANCNVIINGKKIVLNGEVDRENTYEYVEELTLDMFTVEFECDTNDGFLVYEIMLNEGTSASIFTQNANETITNTVNIGAGIEVNASNINTKTRLDADGLRGINTNSDEVIFYQTDEGLYGKKLETESIKSGDLLISTRNSHNFLTGL